MLRALIVTNMWPTPARPARGGFVADQVAALRATGEVELDVFTFASAAGGPLAYARAGAALARTRGGPRHDVVHAHFGLTAWPALAAPGAVHAVTLHGTDLVHPRSRRLTLAALPRLDLVATASAPLAELVPPGSVHGRPPHVLPTGVDLARCTPRPRAEARARLGLDATEPILLLAADPARPEKRADRARALARRAGARLLTLGATPPAEVPDHLAAADAVLVTSERESFGLVALEALACEVPVLSTPVGVAPELLRDLPGTLCAPWDLEVWAAALADVPPRLSGGRERAAPWSTGACARRVLDAWGEALGAAR